MSDTVSTSEAAQMLGVCAAAVRKRARSGLLRASKGPDGAWRIHRDALLEARAGYAGDETSRKPARASPETQLLEAELRHARDTIARLDVQVAEQTDTIRELRGAVTGLTALSAIQRQPRLASWWGRLRRRVVVDGIADV
jgi:uncharacterized coiled-coil protein SlyX